MESLRKISNVYDTNLSFVDSLKTHCTRGMPSLALQGQQYFHPVSRKSSHDIMMMCDYIFILFQGYQVLQKIWLNHCHFLTAYNIWVKNAPNCSSGTWGGWSKAVWAMTK